MRLAARTFRNLVERASVEDLGRPSNGTKWTNEQLLFHMLFGYLVVARLRILVKVFGRLPDRAGRTFAAALESATGPFHVVNYVGSLGGHRFLGHAGMVRRMDRVTERLLRHLDRESAGELERGMHYPPSWDPYFREYMTLAEVYHYPTLHFEHHRHQLTLDPPKGGDERRAKAS